MASHPGAPFFCQLDRQLLLLEDGPNGWTVAELRFEAARCRYIEVRRATYRWPREAAGALLSRALLTGENAAAQVAHDLARWAATHLVEIDLPDGGRPV